jgi:hypothetical protein
MAFRPALKFHRLLSRSEEIAVSARRKQGTGRERDE